MLADICDWCCEFPPKPIVERDVRLDFPAVLRKQIDTGTADVFDLRRSLTIGTRESHQEIRNLTTRLCTNAVAGASVDEVFPTDVKVQRLVKPLPPYIGPEFQRVISDNFTDAVRPLE